MTRQEAKKNLIIEFISEFNETTPVSLTNQNDFILCTNPITNDIPKPTDSSWVRFMIKNNDTPKQTLGKKGSRRYRRTGLIIAKVFIPEGEGTYDGDTLCEEILDIFEGERLGEIVCEKGYYEEFGNDEKGLFLYNVIIPYWFDETK